MVTGFENILKLLFSVVFCTWLYCFANVVSLKLSGVIYVWMELKYVKFVLQNLIVHV